MNHQKQPNDVTCIPTSLAMCLGVSVQSIISDLGHDGMEVVNPEEEGLGKYKFFHPQEIIDVAYKRGFALVIIEKFPLIEHPDLNRSPHNVYAEPRTRFLEYIKRFSGILLDANHAVAWDAKSRTVFDPRAEGPAIVPDIVQLMKDYQELWMLLPIY